MEEHLTEDNSIVIPTVTSLALTKLGFTCRNPNKRQSKSQTVGLVIAYSLQLQLCAEKKFNADVRRNWKFIRRVDQMYYSWSYTPEGDHSIASYSLDEYFHTGTAAGKMQMMRNGKSQQLAAVNP